MTLHLTEQSATLRLRQGRLRVELDEQTLLARCGGWWCGAIHPGAGRKVLLRLLEGCLNQEAQHPKGFGERVQLSVFECWLNPAQLEQLKKLLQKKLEPTEDGVRIYPVGGVVEVLGVGRIAGNPDYLIL
ncbi:CRISPR-associated endonuclease Cas2 [Calidithermus timidus]|jgi:CRISPR-associated protein Cas2|uniref:CRISPR-associated endonuclease Cas2 n=1 Tax=Calidithermus timidus TaxID=307124 RepID=UPI00037ACAD9|nr:CRISPR-associated endonuclease Cas2 [Calidithermus timidus]